MSDNKLELLWSPKVKFDVAIGLPIYVFFFYLCSIAINATTLLLGYKRLKYVLTDLEFNLPPSKSKLIMLLVFLSINV